MDARANGAQAIGAYGSRARRDLEDGREVSNGDAVRSEGIERTRRRLRRLVWTALELHLVEIGGVTEVFELARLVQHDALHVVLVR